MTVTHSDFHFIWAFYKVVNQVSDIIHIFSPTFPLHSVRTFYDLMHWLATILLFVLIKSLDWANTQKIYKAWAQVATAEEAIKHDPACLIPKNSETWLWRSLRTADMVQAFRQQCGGRFLCGLPAQRLAAFQHTVTAFSPVKLNRSPTPRWVTHYSLRRKRENKSTCSRIPCCKESDWNITSSFPLLGLLP